MDQKDFLDHRYFCFVYLMLLLLHMTLFPILYTPFCCYHCFDVIVFVVVIIVLMLLCFNFLLSLFNERSYESLDRVLRVLLDFEELMDILELR